MFAPEKLERKAVNEDLIKSWIAATLATKSDVCDDKWRLFHLLGWIFSA